MSWKRDERTDRLTEWRRHDGTATVRLRERTNGGFVVRLDRLEQAPDGTAYERHTVDSREAAERLARELRESSTLE